MGFNKLQTLYLKIPAISILFIFLVWFLIIPAKAASSAFQVTTNSDDVNQDGSIYDSVGLWLGTGQSASGSYTGLRFNQVSVPQGAIITSAKLQVYSVQSQWLNMGLSFYGEAAANSQTFSSTNRPSQRILTTTRINHSSNTKWDSNTWYTLDEIAPVVQEIVNRPDWQQNNSLAIIIKGSGGSYSRKFIKSRDSSASLAPKLVITYTTSPAPTSTPSISPSPSPIPTPTSTSTTAPLGIVTLNSIPADSASPSLLTNSKGSLVVL